MKIHHSEGEQHSLMIKDPQTGENINSSMCSVILKRVTSISVPVSHLHQGDNTYLSGRHDFFSHIMLNETLINT